MASDFDTAFAAAFWPNTKALNGEAVTYKHAGASTTVTITAVLTWNSDMESTAAGRWPSLEALVADFATAPAKGDQIQIGSVWFTAYALHYGGDGSVRIEFNRIA